MEGTGGPLLEVRGLVTRFTSRGRTATAVDGLDLRLAHGETLGIVGESGCGKTVTALSIMRLVPSPPGRIVSGQVLFEDVDLLGADERTMREIRGNSMAMIFQEPMTSLNPVYTIGEQIAETVRFHRQESPSAARRKAVEMLRLVGIPLPDRRIHEYPHLLSGGMRQRAMIAMALSCNPRLLIADEPTTALDVTIQAQILDLLARMKEEFRMSIILITHDLGVIAEMAERVVVMYAGRIVEEAPVEQLFASPQHPYTTGLLKSIPRLDSEQSGPLHVIPGTVPDLSDLPPGCAFAPRCSRSEPCCHDETPSLVDTGYGTRVRCWLAGGRPEGRGSAR